VPDFQAELLRSAQQGDTGWAEWHWHGTGTDGTRLDMCGVTIFGVGEDRIGWGHVDPRTTQRYDQARHNLGRAATYAVAAYLAGDMEYSQQ
jgi:hypothetical protein